MDEPTTGLDPQGIIEIRNLILRLKNEQNKTIVLSSHQLSEIELIANRMVIINQGKTIIEGSVSELLNSQELVVRLETDNIEATQQLIQLNFAEAKTTLISPDSLDVSIHRDRVPQLNRLLVENNIGVMAIEPKRKLEDYFIKTILS